MTKVALLIGAQDYDAQNEIAPLSCARNDALVFSRVLQERCGFDTVRVLAGEGIAGSDGRPTKNAIRHEIRRLQKSLVRIELLVVAICAHGWSMRLGGVERFYVAPEDAHSDEPDTLLEYEDLMARLDLIPAEQRAIFLDTCRSLPRPGQRDMGGNLLARDLGIELRDRTIPTEDRTTAVISACSAGESAFEMPEVGHGVFFHFLLQGMEGEAWNAQGLTVNDSFAYARKEIAARPIFRQRPTFNQIGEQVIYLAKSKPKDPDGGGDDQKPEPGPDAPQTAPGGGSAQPEKRPVTTEPVDTTPKPVPTGQGETSEPKAGGDDQKPEPGPKEPEGTQITEGTERPRRGSIALGAILLLLALFFYILAVVNPQLTRNVAPNGPEPAAPLTARTQTPAAPTPVPQTVNPPPAPQTTPQAAPAPVVAAPSTAAPAPATPAPQAPVPAPQAAPVPRSTPTPTPQPAPSAVPGTTGPAAPAPPPQAPAAAPQTAPVQRPAAPISTPTPTPQPAPSSVPSPTGPAASAPPPQAPAAASQTAQAPRAQAPPPSSGAAAPAPVAAAPAQPPPAPQARAAANAPTAPPQAVAPSSVRPSSPASGFPVPVGESFRDCPECPEMVVIPAGRSVMGSLRGEAGRLDNEGPPDGPRREVTLRAPLAVGKHEVTRGQFAAFQRATGRNMGEDCLSQSWRRAISWSSPGFEQTDEHPVVCVSWEDAQAYVRWLSERTGQKYRLLTEAEWEYSARAGTQTRYWFGDTIDQRQASFHGDNGNLGRTQPAGIYPQNGFGLHDMHGNVSEWVEDCYVDRYPTGSGEASQAMNQTNCASRVIRGGAWGNAAFRLRSAYRGFDYPTSRADTFGFRVARMPATSGSAASTSAPRVPAARNPASAESSSPGITDCDRLAQPLRSELGRSALVPGVAPTEIDLPRARAACEAAIAAHPQEPRFQAWLGRILEDQDTDYRFISQAVAPTRRAAEMGHAFAQNRYGLMLMRGEYVQRDYAQAAQWFRRAAEQGYAKAQNNYGEILDLEGSRGRIEDFGVRQNVREAALWFRRAAEQGDADGQNNFGVRLASGKGVTQDLSGAVRWFRRAADQGHILAQFTLGHFLQNGLGTEPNLEEAVMWYQRAARQGLPIAEDRLRRLNRSW